VGGGPRVGVSWAMVWVFPWEGCITWGMRSEAGTSAVGGVFRWVAVQALTKLGEASLEVVQDVGSPVGGVFPRGA